MHPRFLGDSYDLVKRFFAQELTALGYEVLVEPMFTGDWQESKSSFYKLVQSKNRSQATEGPGRRALLLDPDTGIRNRKGKEHVSYGQIVEEASRNTLVYVFDQSFSFNAKVDDKIREKLNTIEELGAHALYYNSHARFLFTSLSAGVLEELVARLVHTGIPRHRLVTGDA